MVTSKRSGRSRIISKRARFSPVGSDPGEPIVIEFDAHGHGASVADRFLGLLQQFAQDARPVLQRPAIAVVAPVDVPVEELGDEIAVRGIDIDDVEAGLARAKGLAALCARR
jgi:hypothetical protein